MLGLKVVDLFCKRGCPVDLKKQFHKQGPSSLRKIQTYKTRIVDFHSRLASFSVVAPENKAYQLAWFILTFTLSLFTIFNLQFKLHNL